MAPRGPSNPVLEVFIEGGRTVVRFHRARYEPVIGRLPITVEEAEELGRAFRAPTSSDDERTRVDKEFHAALPHDVRNALADSLAELSNGSVLTLDLYVHGTGDPSEKCNRYHALPWELLQRDPQLILRRIVPTSKGWGTRRTEVPITVRVVAGPRAQGARRPAVDDLREWVGQPKRSAASLDVVDEPVGVDQLLPHQGVDVLVVVAHGRPSEILLADDWVSSKDLTRQLSGRTQLVVLVACQAGAAERQDDDAPFTGVTMALAGHGIAAIGMQIDVPPEMVQGFSQKLNQALVGGQSVHRAVLEARNDGLKAYRSFTWAVPVLWQPAPVEGWLDGVPDLYLRDVKAMDCGVSGLPVEPPHQRLLLDREEELAKLAEVVADDKPSLVWVQGPQGSGKSRLVRHLIAHGIDLESEHVPVVAAAWRATAPAGVAHIQADEVIERVGTGRLRLEGSGHALNAWERRRRQARQEAWTLKARWDSLVAAEVVGGRSLVVIDSGDEIEDFSELLTKVCRRLPADLRLVITASTPPPPGLDPVVINLVREVPRSAAQQLAVSLLDDADAAARVARGVSPADTFGQVVQLIEDERRHQAEQRAAVLDEPAVVLTPMQAADRTRSLAALAVGERLLLLEQRGDGIVVREPGGRAQSPGVSLSEPIVAAVLAVDGTTALVHGEHRCRRVKIGPRGHLVGSVEGPWVGGPARAWSFERGGYSGGRVVASGPEGTTIQDLEVLDRELMWHSVGSDARILRGLVTVGDAEVVLDGDGRLVEAAGITAQLGDLHAASWAAIDAAGRRPGPFLVALLGEAHGASWVVAARGESNRWDVRRGRLPKPCVAVAVARPLGGEPTAVLVTDESGATGLLRWEDLA